ncbi:hypothetical protein EYR38_010542 [Pleurotus pulmonarius]|nr:hypothetical protein EYR38_010542 [Pleurotus pulmonarius]
MANSRSTRARKDAELLPEVADATVAKTSKGVKGLVVNVDQDVAKKDSEILPVMTDVATDAKESHGDEDIVANVDHDVASQLPKLKRKTLEAGADAPQDKRTKISDVGIPSVKEPTAADGSSEEEEGFLSAWAMLRGLKQEEVGVGESDEAADKGPKLVAGAARLYDTRPCELPAKCQVYDETQQATLLKHLYCGLPNLEARAFISWKEDYSGHGCMDFGTWDQYCPYMDLRKGLKAMSFVSFQRVVHLARCDPRMFAARITPRSAGGRSMTMKDSDAAVVSLVPIRVTNCQLTEMNDVGRKVISGIMHSQDMERFVSVICMVFGEQSMYCNLKDDEFTFETRPARREGPTPGNSPYKQSRAATSKLSAPSGQSPSGLSSGSGITAGYVKTSLSGSDPVRIYDGRNIALNWGSDMGKVHTILPRFDGDLLPGSFAVVAHTVTSFRKSVQGVVVGETVSLNVQWVLLLGSPDQPRPVNPGANGGGGGGPGAGPGQGPDTQKASSEVVGYE